MTTVSTIPIICPKCKEKFKSTVVFSFGCARRTTDLRPIYWGFNPMPLWVARCPFCSFADFVNGFENVPYPDPESLEDYRELPEQRKKELKDLKKSTVTNGASELFEIAERYEKEGQPPEKIVTIFKEAIDAIRMSGVSPSPFTFPPTIKIIESRVLNLEKIITHRLSLSEIHRGIEAMRNQKAIKVVITP